MEKGEGHKKKDHLAIQTEVSEHKCGADVNPDSNFYEMNDLELCRSWEA